MKSLKETIIEILEKWAKLGSSEFDGQWLGYDALWDEIIEIGITISMREVKCTMKELSNEKKVELCPTWSNDYQLCGRGWFLCK